MSIAELLHPISKSLCAIAAYQPNCFSQISCQFVDHAQIEFLTAQRERSMNKGIAHRLPRWPECTPPHRTNNRIRNQDFPPLPCYHKSGHGNWQDKLEVSERGLVQPWQKRHLPLKRTHTPPQSVGDMERGPPRNGLAPIIWAKYRLEICRGLPSRLFPYVGGGSLLGFRNLLPQDTSVPRC